MKTKHRFQTFLLIAFLALGSLNVGSYGFAGNLPVDLGGGDLLMSEHPLHGRDGQATLEQQACESVPGGMESVVFGYAGSPENLFENLVGCGVTTDIPCETLNIAVLGKHSKCLAPEKHIEGNVNYESGFYHLLMNPAVYDMIAMEADNIAEPQTSITGEQERIPDNSSATGQNNILQPAQLTFRKKAFSRSHSRDLIVIKGVFINNLTLDCLCHDCTQGTQTANTGIVGNTHYAHPVFIGDNHRIVNVGNEQPGAKFLNIPEQGSVTLDSACLTFGSPHYFRAKFREAGRRFDSIYNGRLERLKREIHAPLEILQFDPLNIVHKHGNRMI